MDGHTAMVLKSISDQECREPNGQECPEPNGLLIV
ncbi:unnamed protein product [Wuchereria bancrofti]|uniref:Uncharacterized protein n=1 Tax=Wuchereria bancrofti TaxID=6293 RepID=A0A3P7GKX3_WUCBA|nr:unnamed protein product [Wuchereria bancrofti]